ncbi:MAG: invasion associated locus B family protein [Gemmatimonas sp.]
MILRSTASALALVLVMFGSAAAQQGPFLGSFQDWEAYASGQGRSRVCYVVTKPVKQEPANVRRGAAFLFVTHRPGDNERDVVNVKAGYKYRPSSTANVAIGNQTFGMYVNDDSGWNRTAQDDRTMVQAMVKGATFIVRGTSERGTQTTDTFSLKGFGAAYQAINKACNIK